MGLKETMQKLAVTAFKTAGNVVTDVRYKFAEDNGFDNGTTISQSIQLIKEQSGSGKYVNSRYADVFSEEILSTDIIGLIPVAGCEYPIVENGEIYFTDTNFYSVKEVTTDPADALYTVLLRKV